VVIGYVGAATADVKEGGRGGLSQIGASRGTSAQKLVGERRQLVTALRRGRGGPVIGEVPGQTQHAKRASLDGAAQLPRELDGELSFEGSEPRRVLVLARHRMNSVAKEMPPPNDLAFTRARPSDEGARSGVGCNAMLGRALSERHRPGIGW